MGRMDVKVNWDYPSFPIDIRKLEKGDDLENWKERLINSGVVLWGYNKMCKNTFERIQKLIEISEALKDYLSSKKVYYLIDDGEVRD